MTEPVGSAFVVAGELVSLIGFRGCGKTSVGRVLAQRLGWSFFDTDDMVEERAKQSIQEIFETEGEKAFRKLEASVVEDALEMQRCVVSVGGGGVLARRNRKALRSAGACVWLTAPAECLYERIRADDASATRRPSLTDCEPLEEIEQLLQARLPIYEATADYVISTADLSVEQVVDVILDALGVRLDRKAGD